MRKLLPILILFATTLAIAAKNPVCDLPSDNNGTAVRSVQPSGQKKQTPQQQAVKKAPARKSQTSPTTVRESK
jgi:hypothetical protein